MNEHENKHDSSSTIDITEDFDSFIDDKDELKLAKLRNNSAKTPKTIEIANIRQLPTLFFLLFIIIISLLMSKFVPQMMTMGLTGSLYKEKKAVKYIPSIIAEQSLTVKVILIS